MAEQKTVKLNLHQKIQKCRVELQESNLKKTGNNKFAGFKYYELADFIPTANKLLDKYGLFTQFTLEKEIARLQVFDTENKTKYGDYEDLDSIEFTIPASEVTIKGANAIQNLGGANTYLKRYLYLNLFEIVEDDSFDAVSGKSEKKATKTVPKDKDTTNKQKVIEFCKKNKIDMNEVAKKYNLNGQSSDEEFSKVLYELEQK